MKLLRKWDTAMIQVISRVGATPGHCLKLWYTA